MTPEEARKKNCPMCYGSEQDGATCAGDMCMAWLWTETEWDRDENKTINVGGRCGFIHPDSIGVRQESH